MNFDEGTWSQIITRPDWYLRLVDFMKAAETGMGEESDDFVKLRRRIRAFFETELLAGRVALAQTGPDMDEQRESIDTVVIHHTSGQPGYRLSYMDAVHLTNIYAPYYAKPTDPREVNLKGQAIWSGHFKDGKQVFYGYHWFMRMDGSFERLLPDEAIGWQAGNWDINKRSVGICLDNDYEGKDPEPAILEKLAAHIQENYPLITRRNIIGHLEAREGTICPGNNFIHGWKQDLLNYLQ